MKATEAIGIIILPNRIYNSENWNHSFKLLKKLNFKATLFLFWHYFH